jgi:NTP pyrophosphatase (non-canonical NTP hydrolase)
MTYQEFVQSVLMRESPINPMPVNGRLLHAVFGIATEAGELLDAFKKRMFYGKQLDETNLVEEFGDLFWYLALGCDALGVTFEEVWERNNAKLEARYGKKFTPEAALNRDLGAERAALESDSAGLMTRLLGEMGEEAA